MPGETWTSSPIRRSVPGTCRETSRPRRSHGIERGDRVEVGHRRLLGGVGLEQRALENLVDAAGCRESIVTVPAMRGDSELPAQLQRRVDVDPAELVAQHLEAARRGVDFEIADAQLVRAEAAADVERLAVVVLEVERLDRHPVRREAERGAPVLVRRAGRDDQERRRSRCRRAVEVRIAARADRLHVDLQLPVTSRTTSVTPSIRPRLIVLDLIATSIGSFGAAGGRTGRAAPCRPRSARRRAPDRAAGRCRTLRPV